ncbi:MAG: tetratricopeptide repeat protein [Desulfovibrio sp.]|jgi:CheY-like chemotaxis protein|nr:tetratricopeptide repeat protein [Desulfovibrio sp.]
MTTARSRPNYALLLHGNPDRALLDRRWLRECCIKVETMRSGVEAASALAEPNADLPDVIVCDEKLEDMDGNQFCAILKLHPRLARIPVLLLLPNETALQQAMTLGSEATSLLGRPFSVNAFKERVQALASAERPADPPEGTDEDRFRIALATFGLTLASTHTAQDFAAAGAQCLRQGHWAGAIRAFEKALEMDMDNGDILLGLATAWKNRGDMDRCRKYLAQAAENYVLREEWTKARPAVERLTAHDPTARNPFIYRAQRLLSRGFAAQAAQVVRECLDVTPEEIVCDRIAQTCCAMDDPDRCLKTFRMALDIQLGDRGKRLADAMDIRLEELVRIRDIRRREAALRRQEAVSEIISQRRKAEGETWREEMAETDETDELAGERREIMDPYRDGVPPLFDPAIEGADAPGGPPFRLGKLAGLSDVLAMIKCTWKLTARLKSLPRA